MSFYLSTYVHPFTRPSSYLSMSLYRSVCSSLSTYSKLSVQRVTACSRTHTLDRRLLQPQATGGISPVYGLTEYIDPILSSRLRRLVPHSRYPHRRLWAVLPRFPTLTQVPVCMYSTFQMSNQIPQHLRKCSTKPIIHALVYVYIYIYTCIYQIHKYVYIFV